MDNLKRKEDWSPVSADPEYPPLRVVRWTYKDYAKWDIPEGERWELIHGRAYMMAAPNWNHQAVLAELFLEIGTILKGKPCKVLPAPFDVRLFYDQEKGEDGQGENDDTVVEPDIVVVCDKEKRGREGCRGAPNLVVEILSPSTRSYDLKEKLGVYLEAGVPECWIVDIENREIVVYTLENKQYSSRVYKAGDTIQSTTLPLIKVESGEVFAEVE
jgi:Uma2 family endonuclease